MSRINFVTFGFEFYGRELSLVRAISSSIVDRSRGQLTGVGLVVVEKG